METNYGKVTVGVGSLEQRQLEIIEFIQARYKDNRVVSVAKLEDETFVLGVENPRSTGRSDQATIWLSRESAIGLIATTLIYFTSEGVDFEKLLSDSLEKNDIDISYSENLTEKLVDNNIINTQ